MSRKIQHLYRNQVAEAYLAGEAGTQIAKRLNISATTVYRCIRELRKRSRKIKLPSEFIRKLYLSGTSEFALARRFHVDRRTMRKRLLEWGIRPRGMSEAQTVRARQMSPQQKARQVAAAHDAVRGSRQSFEHRRKIAIARERNGVGISRGERLVAEMIEARGYSVTLQKAVGCYNVDIALDVAPVAVEIFGGTWHNGGHHAGRFRKRFDYLINAGWYPIIIWVTKDYPVEPAMIDKIVALAEKISGNKAPIRKEQMFWGNGKPAAVGKGKL